MNMKKVAIFVHAGENELGRAVLGLVYADEIHASGGKVKLIFDLINKRLKEGQKPITRKSASIMWLTTGFFPNNGQSCKVKDDC
jgi:hypothetical protein